MRHRTDLCRERFSCCFANQCSLRAFAADCNRSQQEKEDRLRQELSAKRCRLIDNGKPSSELEEVLKAIFAMYSIDCSNRDNLRISYTMACRLWYRCGMKLSSLDYVLEKEKKRFGEAEFKDFLRVVCSVIEADTREQDDAVSSCDADLSNCEVRARGFV